MKHKHTKALSVLLTVCMIAGLLPWTTLSARADDTRTGSCGENLTYTLSGKNNQGYYTILEISGTGAMTNYAESGGGRSPWKDDGGWIDQIIVGNGVTSIGDYAFYKCYGRSITIPDSITSIGIHAFSGTNLTSITIPNSVTSIGAYAFGNSSNGSNDPRCTSLQSVTIPDSVKTIGAGAFQYCTALTSVEIPGTAACDTEIGPNAFKNCTSLTTVTIGDGVKTIHQGAFSYCSSLDAVSIGKNVSSIDFSTFCASGPSRSINTFTIDPENTYFDGDGLFVIDNSNKLTACFKVPSDGVIKIPSNVTAIGDHVFAAKPTITSVIAPARATHYLSNGDIPDSAQIKYICTAPDAATTATFAYDGTERTYELAAGAGYAVSDNKQTNAGSYTAKATLNAESGNVSYVWGNTATMTPAVGSAATEVKTYAWSITAKPVENPTITVDACNYTGAALTPAVTVKDGNTTIPASEYKVSYSNNINAALSTDTPAPTVTITDKTGGNYTVSGTKTFTIGKGTFGSQTASGKAKATGGSGTVDLSALIVSGGTAMITAPADFGASKFASAALSGTKLTATFDDAGVSVGDTESVEVTVTSANYNDYTITVTMTATEKDVPTVSANAIAKTYDGVAVADGDIRGTANVAGTWAFKATPAQALTNVADSGAKIVVFTPEDGTNYESVETTLALTISKANVTGAPTFTKITTAGKTLADAALDASGLSPAGGTLAWDDGDLAEVTRGTAYGWTYTPTDSANYNVKTGTITPWARPASGGGSSGDDTPSTPSTTTTNADGSKTTTTTNADGSKTAVTTKQDGSTVTVNTAKDGSAVTTEKTADGSTATVKTDKSGNVVSTEVNPSAKAIEDAAKSGEPVTLPVEVKAGNDAGSASEVTVTLPKGETGVRVEIPVENLTSGTVAVIVHADGTEEIVKTSTTSRDGVVLTLEESATVKLVDNTKYFSDVQPNDWFAPYIAWAASRGIMNGMGDGTFAPNATASRAQIAQMLFNLDGAQANGNLAAFGDVHAGDWFADAVTWLVENGIAQGTGESFGADSPISREQLAVMLYNYAQFKGYDVSAHGDVSSFPDAGNMNGYAQQALVWAVGAGLISGTTDAQGSIVLDPQGSATRAQIAAIIERFCENVAK